MLTALFLWALFSPIPYHNTLALVLFSLAGATDFLDGWLARRNRLITNFGILMDPLADKIMTCSAFIAFVESTRLDPNAPVKVAAWMVIIIVARELAITGLRLLAASKNVVLAAENFGKHKTVSQIVAINALLIVDACAEWPASAAKIFPVMGAGFRGNHALADRRADGRVRRDLFVAQPGDLSERRLKSEGRVHEPRLYRRSGACIMAGDMQITCSDCGQEFTFSAADQQFFQERGYSTPKRCKPCRKAKKDDQGGSGHRSAPSQGTPVICSGCGQPTTVPFEPRGDRPVYCRDCYTARKGTGGGGSWARPQVVVRGPVHCCNTWRAHLPRTLDRNMYGKAAPW